MRRAGLQGRAAHRVDLQRGVHGGGQAAAREVLSLLLVHRLFRSSARHHWQRWISLLPENSNRPTAARRNSASGNTCHGHRAAEQHSPRHNGRSTHPKSACMMAGGAEWIKAGIAIVAAGRSMYWLYWRTPTRLHHAQTRASASAVRMEPYPIQLQHDCSYCSLQTLATTLCRPVARDGSQVRNISGRGAR